MMSVGDEKVIETLAAESPKNNFLSRSKEADGGLMAADIRTLATLRLRPVAIGVTLLVVLGILFSASESSRDAVWTRMRWRYENDSPDRPKMTTEELRQLVGDEPSFLVRDSHAESVLALPARPLCAARTGSETDQTIRRYGNNNKRYVFEIT